MLQQDLLDTLFLNKKALAGEGGTTTTTATTNTNQKTTTGDGDNDNSHTEAKKNNINMKDTGAAAETQCPVDHNSREAWLAQARAAQQATQQPSPSSPSSQPTKIESEQSSSSSGWGWRIPFFSSSSSSSTTTTTPSTQTTTSSPPHPPQKGGNLGTDRVISSIPRSTGPGATTSACPVNHETETGADPKTGNWVYPSEKMFFDAMRRKGHATQAADMKTVVPIHNAVNERAWHEIREWERPYESTRYGVFSSLSFLIRPSSYAITIS